MRIYPKIVNENFINAEFFFGKRLTLTIGKRFYSKEQIKLYRELFANFTAGLGVLKIALVDSESSTAVLAVNSRTELPVLDVGNEDYALKIDAEKVELHFQNSAALSRALNTVLALIEVRNTEKGKESFTLPQGVARDKPKLSFRAVHLCVFPSTTIHFLRKYMRLAGFMKLSHVVLEFWGTYKFKCFKAGACKGAFTKTDLASISKEAKALGVEIIPMINTLGHASWGNRKSGEHIALFHNPKLAPLYDTVGWNWNVLNPCVIKLQKQLIGELLEVFPDCSYVHLGCDEAFGYGADRVFKNDKNPTEYMVKHINALADYVKQQGRIPLMWGDMLLPRKPEWVEHKVECHAQSEESARIMLSGLDRDIILVDWQYTITYDDIPTAKFLSEHGFKVIMASWNQTKTRVSCQANVEKYGYEGMMLTTWNELRLNTIFAEGATLMWNGVEEMQAHFNKYGGTASVTVINYYIRNIYRPKFQKLKDSGAYKGIL